MKGGAGTLRGAGTVHKARGAAVPPAATQPAVSQQAPRQQVAPRGQAKGLLPVARATAMGASQSVGRGRRAEGVSRGSEAWRNTRRELKTAASHTTQSTQNHPVLK